MNYLSKTSSVTHFRWAVALAISVFSFSVLPLRAQQILLPSAGLAPVSSSSGTPGSVVRPLNGAMGISGPLRTIGTQGSQEQAIAPTENSDAANELPSLDSSVDNSNSVILPSGYNDWRLKPILKTGYMYDNNLFISNKNPQASSIYYAGGGLNFEIGDYHNLVDSYLIVHYIGTAAFYANATQLNGYCQDFGLSAKYKMSRSKIELVSSMNSGNAPNSDVGGMVNGLFLLNALRFAYDYSDNTILDSELNQSSTTKLSSQGFFINNISTGYNNFNNSSMQSIAVGFFERLSDKLKLGLQGIYGLAIAQNSPNQTYQIANARLNYKLTGKLSLAATAGAEFIEFQSGGLPVKTEPVFSISSLYAPTENTSISLSVARSFNNSQSITAQDYMATGFNLRVSHTMLTRWTPSLSLGYANNGYFATLPGISSGRADNIFSIRPSLGYTFLKDFTANLFYQWTSDRSNQQVYTYNDALFGIQFTSVF